jgi:hypothetical protein
MGRWVTDRRLNLQRHKLQNDGKSLPIFVPKTGYTSLYRKTLSHGVAVFGGKVRLSLPGLIHLYPFLTLEAKERWWRLVQKI